MAFRPFICASNRSDDPFRTRNEAVGVLVVYDDGNYDFRFCAGRVPSNSCSLDASK